MNEKYNLINDKKKVTLLIIILGAITAIGPLAIDTYLPAFSAINADFKNNNEAVQLTLSSYFLGLAIAQLFYGPIIDRYGKKIPLLFGITLFIITSILCAFSRTIEELIIFRFFQAFGSCACFVVPRAIVRDLFKPQETARIFSYLILIMGIFPIIAPIIGSFILEAFGWRAIFMFFVIFSIVLFIISYFFLPESKAPNKDDKISNTFKKYSSILQDRNFTVSSISIGILMAGLFSYLAGSPYVYLNYFGISSKNYSYLFAANAVIFVVFAKTNAILLNKFSMRDIIDKIIFLPALAGVILIIAGIFFPNFWLITFAIFLSLGAIGMINPNLHAIALANQGSHTGSASSLLGTIQFTCAIIASLLINLMHNDSTLPLAFIVGGCGIMSSLVFKIFAPKQNLINDTIS